MLNVLDLFSGAGMFSLGLEETGGFKTVAFCDAKPFARRVLAKHWPGVPIYNDVRDITEDRLRRDGIFIDVICGGFPCQDISFSGLKGGIARERSGLWFEYARIIREFRPRFVFVENVAALLDRGMGDVLGSLAACGYDAEWDCIPAAAVGARQVRDRAWIVAYPAGVARNVLATAFGGCRAEVRAQIEARRRGCGQSPRWGAAWLAEPGMDRVVDGCADRVDRIDILGNSLVRHIPRLIGHAALAAEAAR